MPNPRQRNHNVSERNFTVSTLKFLGIVAAVALIGYLVLGLGVDLIVDHISTETELKIANKFTMQGPLRDALPVPAMGGLLQPLLDEVLQGCPDVPYPVRVEVVESDLVNAFSLLGGTIQITTGILQSISTENQLVFILGHELGHLAHRDQLRGMGRVVMLALAMTALQGSNQDSLGQTATYTALAFSRSQELAADRYGLEVVGRKYGHAGGADEFFGTMRGNERLQRLDSYFSTHPAPADRIKKLHEAMARLGLDLGETTPINPALRP